MSALPLPAEDVLAHSGRLIEHLRAEIEAGGGWISFARYMELALYAPGLGYYAAGAAKFGAAGDFVTAPELTPLFGQTLARSVAAVLAQCGGEVLELGAGSGRLAVDLLLELERLQALPSHYAILELSADLRQRQRQRIAAEAAHLLDRVSWLEALPDHFTGVVLANEVLDALPVHLLHWTEAGLLERGVSYDVDGFVWQDRPLNDLAVPDEISALDLPVPYLTELNLAAPALIASLAERLQAGALLFVDYGFPRAEYYHPQRDMGTLRVHYRHHSLDDPFFLPGLCDLTAHVDFTAVAEAGVEAGLDFIGYTSQASYLLDAGLLERMQQMSPDSTDYLRVASAVQKLIQPQEMGELFKVIALGRGIDSDLPGFRRGERSASL